MVWEHVRTLNFQYPERGFPQHIANGSAIPHGTPTNSSSAFWASRAIFSRESFNLYASFKKAVIESSKLADDPTLIKMVGKKLYSLKRLSSNFCVKIYRHRHHIAPCIIRMLAEPYYMLLGRSLACRGGQPDCFNANAFGYYVDVLLVELFLLSQQQLMSKKNVLRACSSKSLR